MSIKRGDVVLLQAPFASRAGVKTRPMLVVQNDTNNARMANTILVFITTNLTRASEPTQVLVDVGTPEGQASGLKQTSVVSCENILTVVQNDILRTIGHLPDVL
ncbi:MAG: type II toxin-antitoxin system PemK/MazF family toxin, partial [Planctomycetes bacterium]|nr:type II toxin-antitoxin system PemK/MazF family toxin [Planctomycetota bacterium]